MKEGMIVGTRTNLEIGYDIYEFETGILHTNVPMQSVNIDSLVLMPVMFGHVVWFDHNSSENT